MQSVAECEPSRFLDEIPEGLVEYHKPSAPVDTQTAQDIFAAMKLQFGKK